MSIKKRVPALITALLIALSIVINPIIASAAAAAGAAIGAGFVLDLLFTGYATSEAVALKQALDNGTIDNNIEQWLWDKASEWEYGYNQAKVNGEIYMAEFTYGEMKRFADLLDQAYPDGSIKVNSGHIVNQAVSSDFPIAIPIDTDVFFTDASQDGLTATTTKIHLKTINTNLTTGYADLICLETVYILPSGEIAYEKQHDILGGELYSNNIASNVFGCEITQSGFMHTHTISTWHDDGYVRTDDFYYKYLYVLSESTLVSGAMPVFKPAEGVDVNGQTVPIDSDKFREIPYGMSDDDIAISIPITPEDLGEDVGDDSKPDVRPGVIPDDLIDEVPEAEIEGDFSNFTLPNGLMYVFPFSLPYDFYRGIKLFSAAPEVPEFTFNFTIPYPSGMGTGNLVDQEITLNFKQFEKLAIISRWISTFGFTMLLIKLSAFILKGGNS